MADIPHNVETIDINNLTVAYRWTHEPTSRAVVMLHGLGDSSLMTFGPFFEANGPFAETPALLLDFPGFGYSSAPDHWNPTVEDLADLTADVLVTLDVSEADVVAHSMGGSVGIMLAHRHPDLVRSLCVAEALLVPENSKLAESMVKRSEAGFVADGYRALVRATRRQAARGEAASVAFVKPLDHAVPRVMYRLAASLLEERSPTFEELLASLAIPRTFLIGERTEEDPSSISEAGVTVVRIPDAGHAMMSENPQAFAAAIQNALLLQGQHYDNPSA